MKRHARIVSGFARLVLLALCFLSAHAFAVSLGDELILSRLGDPVEVEVEVLQWEDMDLERVEITAASREEYEVFKLTWLPVLEDLDFNLVGPDLDGNVRVLISSRAPLNEPFLELLLVLRWPGGSLRREYVLLFDPPGMALTSTLPAASDTVAADPVATQPTADPVPAAREEPPVAAPALAREEAPPLEPAGMPPQAAAPAAPEAEPVPALASTPPETSLPEASPPAIAESDATVTEDAASIAQEPEETVADVPDARTQLAIEVETLAPPSALTTVDTTRRTYQVRAGDSLWNIARQFRPAGAGDNLYQMLLGIHDLNRGSFINGNISLLKANALLQIPTADDIAAIDAGGAEAEFDRRWEAGTARFDAVQRGEAIPLFANAAPVEADAPEFEADLPPGVEAPTDTDEDDLIMVSATNVPQPLQLVPGPEDTQAEAGESAAAMQIAGQESAPVAADDVASASGSDPAATMPPAPSETPPTATITVVEPGPAVPAQTVGVIVSRASLTADLETEVAAMRARRATAEAIAQQLKDSLQRAQEERAAQSSPFSAQNLLLAGGALVLLAALLAGGAFSLKIAGELRAQRAMGNSDDTEIDAGARPAWLGSATEARLDAGERREPRLPEMEVVELEVSGAQAVADAPQRRALSSDDLFARMDDMLGTTANPPKK